LPIKRGLEFGRVQFPPRVQTQGKRQHINLRALLKVELLMRDFFGNFAPPSFAYNSAL